MIFFVGSRDRESEEVKDRERERGGGEWSKEIFE